jgi:hypothetical protein
MSKSGEIYTLQAQIPLDIDRLAANIVHQIGDELFERGLMNIQQRQDTNDLFINFVSKILIIHKRDVEIEFLQNLSDKLIEMKMQRVLEKAHENN